MQQFEVGGTNPLSTEQTRIALAPYTGEHTGVEGLRAAADALEKAIADSGIPFHKVVLPPQSLTEGSVRLEVVAFRLTNVIIDGNRHFSTDNIRRSLPALSVGEIPDTQALAPNLRLANEHASKKLEVTFTEDEAQIAGLAANVTVADQKPWEVYSGISNTGSKDTGSWRWTVGGSYNNLWDRDHSIGASYTTSPGHFDDVKQWGITYRLPMYRLPGYFTAYFLRSDVNNGRILELFDVKGSGRFSGIRYTHLLPKYGSLQHRISLGVDDKLFDNSVVVVGVNVASNVRSRPFNIEYAGNFDLGNTATSFNVSYVQNIPVGRFNSETAYAANRGFADPDWRLLRVSSQTNVALAHDLTLRVLTQGQFTTDALIPGEQFGAGGLFSVRGFRERAVTGDTGMRVGVELWSPTYLQQYGGLRALIFADAGKVFLKSAAASVDRKDTIASVGVGARWQWKKHALFSFDVAKVVDGSASRDGGARGHLNLLVRY